MNTTQLSSVLLAALMVTGLSLARPDDREYKIPEVGNDDGRSQYYVLHRDGTFKYGYDTGSNAYEAAKRHSATEQKGKFGYRAPDGRDIRLEYKAGRVGFLPTGDHIPQPSPEFRAAFEEAKQRPAFVDPLAESGLDRSYSFDFDSDDQSRAETSNSDGTVTGSYSYIDDFGEKREFSYKAGKGIGFVITGDGLDQPTAEAPRQQTIVHRPATVSHTPRRRYKTSSQAAAGHVTSKTSDDGSYSFFYKAPDHSRRESADRNLNVEGSFSFVADDGKRRTLNYNAGSETGFQAEGDHLPVPPEVPEFGSRKVVSQHRRVSTALQRQTPTSPQKTYFTPGRTSEPIDFEEANIRSHITPAGPYSFSYETSSHSRSETGDEDNNVDGDFSFIADDGVRREIKYEAGSDTGFIAEGDHIPVGAIVPGAPTGQPTGRLVRVRSEPFVDPLADTGSDASYNFGFESETYSRSETANEDGTVTGTYTMVDENGNKITYRFRAGKGIGFETEEISRQKVAPPTFKRHPVSTVRKVTPQFTAPVVPKTPSVSRTPPVFRTPSVPRAPSFKHKSSPQVPSFKGSFAPKRSDDQDFTLHKYEHTEDADKFGYVLKFN